MKTFIRATEVWVLNHDGSYLELASADYGDMTSLQEVSATMRFAYDEGLPGKAWSQGHPIILKHLQGSYFKRAEAAREWGLTCGIALPVFSGEFIKAVIVLLCGDDEQHVGAIEIWHNDASAGADMNLHDGYYGSADLFAWRSSVTSFRKGVGLPGKTWANNRPSFLTNLVDPERFLRHEGAVRAGLTKGLALPFLQNSRHAYIVALLSARGTPIARRFEIWTPNPANPERLKCEAGDCDIDPEFISAYAELGVARGDGVIGQVWLSGLPVVSSLPVPQPSIAEINAEKAGLNTIVALPMIYQGQLTNIVSWYF
jgi:hypothetical protein